MIPTVPAPKRSTVRATSFSHFKIPETDETLKQQDSIGSFENQIVDSQSICLKVTSYKSGNCLLVQSKELVSCNGCIPEFVLKIFPDFKYEVITMEFNVR